REGTPPRGPSGRRAGGTSVDARSSEGGDALGSGGSVAHRPIARRGEDAAAGRGTTMRVLVTTASDEETEAIGARIGSVLRNRGHVVDLRRPDEVIEVDDYDVVVLGSATAEGHWAEDARLLVLRAEGELACRPVWLFTSDAEEEPTSGTTVVDVTDV